jgi:hypothetical protein
VARPVRIWYDASLVDEVGNGPSAAAAAIVDSGMQNGSGFYSPLCLRRGLIH